MAAWDAAARHRPLRVVQAFSWPLFGTPLGPVPFAPPDAGLRHDAEKLVAEAVDEARKTASEIGVTGEVVEGAATRPTRRAAVRHCFPAVRGQLLRRWRRTVDNGLIDLWES